jgi:hypothetical protein
LKIKTLTTERANEYSRSHLTNAPLYPSLSVNNFSINGIPINQNNLMSASSPLQFPDEILAAMGKNKNFRMKIYERSYDISIDEGAFNQEVPSKQAIQSKTFFEKLNEETIDLTSDCEESKVFKTNTQTKHKSKFSGTKVEVKVKSESDNEGKKKLKSSKSVDDKPQMSTSRLKKSKSFSEVAADWKTEGKSSKKAVEVAKKAVEVAKKAVEVAKKPVEQEAQVKEDSKTAESTSLKRPAKQSKAGTGPKKVRKRGTTLPSSFSSDDDNFPPRKPKQKVAQVSKTTLGEVMNENVIKKKPARDETASKTEKAGDETADSLSDDFCLSPKRKQKEMEKKSQAKTAMKKDLKARFDGKENNKWKKKTENRRRHNLTIIDSSESDG